MNILIIDYDAGNPLKADGRSHWIAKEWRRLGNRVTVVTSDFSTDSTDDYRGKLIYRVENEVQYVYIKCDNRKLTAQAANDGLLNFIKTLRKASAHLAENYKPNIVICASKLPFDIFATERIAKAAGAKMVFDLTNIIPRDRRGNMMYAMLYKSGLKRSLKKADLIVSALPYADKGLANENINHGKIKYIPTGIYPSDAKGALPQEHRKILQKYRDKGMFIAMFAGELTEGRSLDDFILSSGECSEDVVLVIAGDGPMKLQFKKMVKENELENVLFLDGVERSDFVSLISLAHCLYVDTKVVSELEYSVNMRRVGHYYEAARPIIYTGSSERNPLRGVECGVHIELTTPSLIAQAIEKLKSTSKEKLSEMGKNLKDKILQDYAVDVVASRYLEDLEELNNRVKFDD